MMKKPMSLNTACILFILPLITYTTNSYAKSPSPAVAKLAPQGWKVLISTEGDLNKDSLADVAMIVEKLKPDIVVKDDDGKAIHNHPRQLMVFFKTVKGYQHIATNKKIPVAEQKNSCLVDPIEESADGLKIKNGVLSVDFSYFMSCGGWEWPRHFFTFRWQQNQFKLIGFNYNSFYRNTGEETSKSYNFSTLKLKETHGNNAFEGGKPKTTWTNFKAPPNLNLNTINFDDFYSQFKY